VTAASTTSVKGERRARKKGKKWRLSAKRKDIEGMMNDLLSEEGGKKIRVIKRGKITAASSSHGRGKRLLGGGGKRMV